MSRPAAKRQKSATTAAAADPSSSSADDAASPAATAASAPAAALHPIAQKYASISAWLMKNEPPYSLAALRSQPAQTEAWVGVRNREARNMMQHAMKKGHRVLYYNASIANPHIAGIARVSSSAAYADPSAFDASSPYFDAESDPKNPTWFLVDVTYEREFVRPVYLAELRAMADAGHKIISPDFTLFRRRRLSIHSITDEEFDCLVALADTPLPEHIKLKPEKETSAVQAHPSRARKSNGTEAGQKRKRAQKKSLEQDEEE